MLKKVLPALAVLALAAGCASTSGPATSWGKPGVSMVDYRIDSGQCAIIAASSNPLVDGDGAGGLRGSNQQGVVNRGGDAAVASGANNSGDSGTPTPTSGNFYRDAPPDDMVQRAANQQRAQELALRRARDQALENCLVERGYREFRLTEAQRAHLATLPEGSEERRVYLHGLGADPAVLEAQGL